MAAPIHKTSMDVRSINTGEMEESFATSSSLSASTGGPHHILPQEQQFLEMYFTAISHFAFDRSKELVDQEKEAIRSHPTSLWAGLVSALSVLASAEKTYMHLAFFEQKWFGRQSGKWLFSSAMSDVRRVELRGKEMGHQGSNPEDRLLSHLCEQLVHFIEARQEMMELYEKLCYLGSQKADINISDLTVAVGNVISRHAKQFHHPILSSIRSNLSLELEALHAVFMALEHLAQFSFLPALLSLNESQCKLDEWGASIKLREAKKKLQTMAPGKVTGIPPLMVWYVRFQAAQLSKFSLYFHEMLAKQALPGDMKTHLSNLSIDYYTKIALFQKKSDALNISLVFDTRGSEDTYKGHGYHHPNSFCEPPKGLDSYPAIFSFPNTQQITYYISRVDIKMSLVIIFEAKKSERDTNINNFLQEMGQLLRVNKLFASLRQGAKTKALMN
ncbi:KICSTOR complex protein C12orf66 homolog isoform X2 [Acanthaster planci]|uniref:KICSTOR complex protein C12orf66 homolog isoform X2 n=1 Tax=Acanthaster planci TaxID=133434 RepID=A0A8B7YHM3_ACAPL|nr:KICSTOR complex protein C12orf66 homolog isoform X2 [Acanthaster planci]